jgi:DnaJ-class molecular chaperone
MAELDYYKVLGVSREATDDEIRKAYKKLAREFHPDVKPDDAAADTRFKQVQEAYAVLGDAEKREQYDRYGAAFQGGAPFPGGSPFGRGPGGGGQPFDLDDLFGGQVDLGSLFGGRGQPGGGFGGFGGGGRAAQPAKGQDSRIDIEIPFTVAAQGGAHELGLQRNGKLERLVVKIQAGVDNGTVIRLAGKGQPGGPGTPAGDLLVQIKVGPHPWFRREGCNLLLDVPISPEEAVLGAKVDVPTLSDGNVIMTIPPGTSSGTRLRLRGKGVVQKKTGICGDQLVIVKVVVPREPSDEVHRLYEQIAEKTSDSPRDGMW